MLTLIHRVAVLDLEWRLVVYTDRPGEFSRFNIPCVTHRMSELRSPPGSPDFPLWPKILAFEHCAAQYEGSIVLFDTDTYFVQQPEAIFRNLSHSCSVMHTCEWPLSAPGDESFASVISDPPLLDAHAFETETLRRLPAVEGAAMWNAGVVGLHESRVGLVAEIVDVCEELLRFYSAHTLEQLAFSLVLQANTRVVPSDGIVCHYWHSNRLAIEYSIVRFLRRNRRCSLDLLASRAAELDPAATYTSNAPVLELALRRRIREARGLARSRARTAKKSHVVRGDAPP